MSEWIDRLRNKLEPILAMPDPRPQLSAYHDMPYAIFHYPADVEFSLRSELSLLRTRLSQGGKRITTISLAKCLERAMAEQLPLDQLIEAEKEHGVGTVIETINTVLAEYAPLVDLVADELPSDPDPTKDIVFIVRTGALFGLYRTFSLLEQLKGRLFVPAVLFYPGEMDGAAGLRSMGVLEAEHNYRPKIF